MKYFTLAAENTSGLNWGVFVPHGDTTNVTLATVIALSAVALFFVSFNLNLWPGVLGKQLSRFRFVGHGAFLSVTTVLAVGVAMWALNVESSVNDTVPVSHIAETYDIDPGVLPERVSSAQTRLPDDETWLVRAKVKDFEGTAGFQWGLIPDAEFDDWAAGERAGS